MQTESMRQAARLLQAGRECTSRAIAAEGAIETMVLHADFVITINALMTRMSLIEGVDYSAVLDALDEVDAALDKAYAISPEERSEAVGNEMKESRDE